MQESTVEKLMMFPVIPASTILELAHFYLIEGVETDIEVYAGTPADFEVSPQKSYLVNAIIMLVDISLEGVVDELLDEMVWDRETANVADSELGQFRKEAAEHLFDIFFPETEATAEWKENYRIASAMLYLSELRYMVLASLPDRVENAIDAEEGRLKKLEVKRLPPPPPTKNAK